MEREGNSKKELALSPPPPFLERVHSPLNTKFSAVRYGLEEYVKRGLLPDKRRRGHPTYIFF